MDRVTTNGFDTIVFLISPNKGEPLRPLSKIISGGEMSRFMLALKVIIASIDGIGTLVFDEIDTGISGKIAFEVAKKLYKISKSAQVIAVTHLPQLAAVADSNYLIEKKTEGDSTNTYVYSLSEEDKLKEISRLSGGVESSLSSEKHAVDLIDSFKQFKASL
jgi:DNA repair protein RecN (Recombination protein N)